MSMMKEISDACLAFKMGIIGLVVVGTVIGTAAGVAGSSVWIGMGAGIVSGGITAWRIFNLPWYHS
ncbi:MAG: hypothetical protein A3A44_00295 [Candidatus Sungbacteria bacterium RIFCSPLOWO2_01_FULL_60_25]|uniref:Uncharacterized protein n=1 Tax=Candidatus Sungbacteria bacterium RIFCSPLOWO2_01_FULL_60_25 TaxID=1802281 RepID=A0A1G2LCR9_9BACT|nr:MAG: hypothetical protein A3A44_00295 [Candidatus Sungbacteria bacterium RIFCSPLOWO2_01_FULL_60_25]